MNKNNLITLWVFQDAWKFGFVIPKDKSEHKSDFFIAGPNTSDAENGDLVEVEIFEKNRWKNKEAKILSVIKKSSENKQSEDNIVWKYSQWNWDFWFVDVEWEEKGYYVFPRNKNNAMDGDKVEASVKIFKWKPEATIVRIIERKKGLVVWTYKKSKWNFGFVLPKDVNIKNDIFIAAKNSYNAEDWDIVWVEITRFAKRNPEWVIREIIWGNGKLDKREEEILTLAIEWWARITFPNEVNTQLSKISENISQKELERRKDFRDLFTFTIDGADAKDLDDAISLEVLDNGDYKLYVHIADVTNYVTENSSLDEEALQRATSTYLADRVIPMLPTKLSNNLCSLNPHTDKLTLTCEMHIWWKTGHLVSSKVWESVIKSDFRLTYKDVDDLENKSLNIGDELMFKGEVTKQLLDIINHANLLKVEINKHRKKVWTIDFDFPETVVVFDKNGEPCGIKEYPKYNSNKLIEAFMVSANEAVAKQFSDHPFLYRIHEAPKEINIKDLQDKLNLFWIKYKFEKWDTLEFSDLLKHFSDLPDSKRMFLEKMTLRTLTQANYSDKNLWHFWLWLTFYSHFTSPIRRYPDLQIHRIIKEFLSGKNNIKRENHYKNILPKVATQSSERERKSQKLEYRVRDYFVVKYYKNKIWQEFDWIINWMIPKWFFVTLTDTAEWFVEIPGWFFDDNTQTHRDTSWNKFMLWDSVKVKLIEADEKLLRLNFEVIL